jgi:uncharacterized Fe-S cluster protein YjdI
MDAPARTYEHESIAVAWYPERCLHTARCIMGLPDVFDPRRRPWIVLEGHTADEIAAVVERCPRGHARGALPLRPVTAEAVL